MSETLPLSARLQELEETFRRTVVPSNWYREHHQRYLDLIESFVAIATTSCARARSHGSAPAAR
jgi:hypothetical protein